MATLELKALDRAHVAQARAWRNLWAVWQWTRQNDLISDLEQERWYERQSTDPTVRMYAVVMKVGAAETLVGVAGLTSIDWPNRRAEFSLYIGPEHQKNGHGRAALATLLMHAFQNLGLHQVWGETFHGNPALKLFGEMGFTLDGKRREAYWKDGTWIDSYMISILEGEWREKHGPVRQAPPDATGASGGDRDPGSVAPPARGRPRKAKLAAVAEAPPAGTSSGAAADAASVQAPGGAP